MNKVLAMSLILLLAIPVIFSGCRFFTPYTISLSHGYRLVESPPGALLYKSGVAAVEGKIIHFRPNAPWFVGDMISDKSSKKRRYVIINLQTGSIHCYSYSEPNERSELMKQIQAAGISLADPFFTLGDFKTGNRSLDLLSK